MNPPADEREPQLPRRRGGPTLRVAVDALRQARSSGNWIAIVVLVLALVAILLAGLVQVVAPWLIYPAL